MSTVLRSSKTQAILSAAAALLIGLLLALTAHQSLSRAEQDVTDTSETLERLRSYIAADQHLADWSEDSSVQQLQAFFLGQGTTSELSAQLSSTIATIAGGHGLQVLRTSEAPAIHHGDLVLVGAALELTGTWENILQTLEEIGRHRPSLVLNGISLRRDASYPAGSPQEQQIGLVLRVYGFLKPGS